MVNLRLARLRKMVPSGFVDKSLVAVSFVRRRRVMHFKKPLESH